MGTADTTRDENTAKTVLGASPYSGSEKGEIVRGRDTRGVFEGFIAT